MRLVSNHPSFPQISGFLGYSTFEAKTGKVQTQEDELVALPMDLNTSPLPTKTMNERQRDGKLTW